MYDIKTAEKEYQDIKNTLLTIGLNPNERVAILVNNPQQVHFWTDEIVRHRSSAVARVLQAYWQILFKNGSKAEFIRKIGNYQEKLRGLRFSRVIDLDSLLNRNDRYTRYQQARIALNQDKELLETVYTYDLQVCLYFHEGHYGYTNQGIGSGWTLPKGAVTVDVLDYSGGRWVSRYGLKDTDDFSYEELAEYHHKYYLEHR